MCVAPSRVQLPSNLRYVFRRRTGVRVRQRIRKFELWPVFKLAVAFHAICGAISLGVLTLIWQIGENAGFTDRVVNFLVDIGFAESVRISGASLFRGAFTVAVGLVLHNTVVTVLLAALYNLLSGLLGGVIMSVVEDDQIRTVGRRAATPRERRSSRRERGKQTPAPAASAAPVASVPARQTKLKREKRAVVAVSTPKLLPVKSEELSAEELDDADWLAALADDTFDDDLDLTVENPFQGRFSRSGQDESDATGSEAR